MDIVETQKMFKELYPDHLVKFEFDEKGIRKCECIMTDGLPNLHHHLEFDKVRVTIDGVLDKYVPITTHRITTTWAEYKKIILSKNEVFIHSDQIKELSEAKNNPDRLKEYETMINELSQYSGMTKEDIEVKLQ